MSKIIYIFQNKTNIVDSMKEMFQELAKDNHFVASVEDGKITIAGETPEVCEFYFLSSEGTKESLENEVSVIRDEMRKAVALMQSQGLKLAPAEMKKLTAQFEFLSDKKDAK